MNKELVSKMRGFNLLDMFASDTSSYYERIKGCGSFLEKDFRLIHDLGFNFVRVPLSYRVWGKNDDLLYVDKKKFSTLDNLVEWADKYNIHINIAMHRAPGYCVNKDEKNEETLELWKSDEALDAFKFHFHKIAERYKHLSLDKLSYNVINEPPSRVSSFDYSKVCRCIIDEVRSVDPERYFMIDGLAWGRDPHFEFLRHREKNIIYSCRGYDPMLLTHHGTEPARRDSVEKPVWPERNLFKVDFCDNTFMYGTEELKQDVDLWGAVKDIYDVPVICGEMGVYRKVPHAVALRWLDDLLRYLSMNQIGWAMWNFSGNFGVVNSNRSDVEYEDFYGYKLDRKMMDILLKYI